MAVMKYCYKCKQEKSLEEFAKDSSRSDGYSNRCKTCRQKVKISPRESFEYVEYKVCSKCKLEKCRDCFRKDSRMIDGLSSNCTECRKQQENKWRDLNRPSLRLKVKRSNAKAKQECRNYAINYLKNHPCIECDENDIIVLDFDHVDPSTKKYGISNILRGTCGVSLKKLILEIEKCQIRCANCHRRRTAKQFGSWKHQHEII